jgi:thiamine-monophosphate kinase
MSDALLGVAGDGRAERLAAAGAGDDYELLFAAPEARTHEIVATAEEIGLPLTRVGTIEEGRGLILTHQSEPVALPAKLGFEHRR